MNLIFLAITLLVQAASTQNGCLVWQSNLYCSQCDTAKMYYQVGNGCIRYSGNACTSIDYLGNCINCQQGFYLAYGNTCTLVNFIVGCLNYSTDSSVTICQSCAAGYILVQNRCLATIANCNQYIVGTNICAQCALGYTQAADWCSCVQGTIQNCVQYDCIGLCVQCAAAFPRLSVNRGSCLINIPYCAVYLPNTNGCKSCAYGWVLSSDSLACLTGILYCATYTPTTATGTLLCVTCKPNYYLSTDKTKCVGLIVNCKTIDYTNLICSECNPGFVTSDDNKVCLPSIQWCFKYQPSSYLSTVLRCQSCATGYQLDTNQLACIVTCGNGYSVCQKTNTCSMVPTCCEFHDGCGNCLTVKAGQVWCQRQYCVTIPAECPNNYDSCGNCFCADPSFSWCKVQKKCVQVPSCCASHDGCGNCVTTVAGSTWCAATSSCVQIPTCANYDNCGNCLCLQTGFTLCKSKNTCVQVPICCPTSSDGCGNCVTLLPNYTWCVATNQCALKNLSCPNNNDGCGNCVCPTGQNWCQSKLQCVFNPSCPSGSTYDGCGSCVCPNNQVYCATSNKCVAVLSCCAQWDVCGICTTYKAGFALCATNNQCVQIPTACQTSYNCVTGLCLCPGSQTWCVVQNKCVTVPACCLTNDSCGNCLTTQTGSVFLNGQCFYAVIITGCIAYSANLQTCTQCAPNLILSFNKLACWNSIILCSSYATPVASDIGPICLTCTSPYFLSNNICIIPRCITENRTATSLTCNLCQSVDVINTARNVCGIAIQFCTAYNFSLPIGNNCITCAFPYVITSSNLCSTANYMILQYSAAGAVINSNLYFFGINVSSYTLGWVLYNSANSGSGWAFSWEVSAITLQTTFSIRVQISSTIPGNSSPTLNYYHMTSSTSSNLLTAELYQSQSSGNVAILGQQFYFTQSTTTPGAVNIKCAANNLYVGYGLTMSATPVDFFLSKQ